MTAVTVVTVIAYLFWYTSLFAARTVEVTGLSSLTVAEVRAAAGISPDTPMARLEADEIAERVRGLSRVDDVTVELSWPDTVRLSVTERVAVFHARVDGVVALIDRGGADFARVGAAPPGLPELRVRSLAPGDEATGAALAMLTALDDSLRPEVLTVQVDTPTDVRLSLTGARQVLWGSGERPTRKAAVLRALLTQPGKIYNVSTPDLPTITP